MKHTPTERFEKLPGALRALAINTTLSEHAVPALLAHPDAGWKDAEVQAPQPRPVVIWIHGRTVYKELDPGRYLRWLRAEGGGIAACALDLPDHGDRFVEGRQGSDSTLEIVEQMAGEIDAVVAALGAPEFRGAFDLERVAIGGMSAGGMATLIRLTQPHGFRAAAVECTAGDFAMMQRFSAFYTRGGKDPSGESALRLNPASHLEQWRPIPLLALHSELDEWVPVGAIRSLMEALQQRYRAAGAEAEMAELFTWPSTGAPNEHAGFGRVASEAKDRQLAFLLKWLQ